MYIPQLHWSVSHLTRLLRGTLVSFQLLYILLRRSCAGFFPQHLIPRAAVCGFFIRSSQRGLFRRAWPPSIQYNSAQEKSSIRYFHLHSWTRMQRVVNIYILNLKHTISRSWIIPPNNCTFRESHAAVEIELVRAGCISISTELRSGVNK